MEKGSQLQGCFNSLGINTVLMRLGKQETRRNHLQGELRGLGDCLGTCRRGDGELRDNWGLAWVAPVPQNWF